MIFGIFGSLYPPPAGVKIKRGVMDYASEWAQLVCVILLPFVMALAILEYFEK